MDMQPQVQPRPFGSPPLLSTEEIEAHRFSLERAAALPLPAEARAMAVAAVAHQWQFRKGTGLPYITHLIEVHSIVCNTHGTNEAQRVAAILHDYDEDSEYTFSRPGDVRRWFGDEPADYVSWLTDVSKPEDGNRATRRAIDRAHSAKAPPRVQTVKYGDVLSNARNIVETIPSFAEVWLPEKLQLMAAIPHGDATLRSVVMDVLDQQVLMLSEWKQSNKDKKHRGARP